MPVIQLDAMLVVYWVFVKTHITYQALPWMVALDQPITSMSRSFGGSDVGAVWMTALCIYLLVSIVVAAFIQGSVRVNTIGATVYTIIAGLVWAYIAYDAATHFILPYQNQMIIAAGFGAFSFVVHRNQSG